MAADPTSVRKGLRLFARMCAERAPLYAVLSAAAADDPEIVALCTGAEDRHPPTNLLFGAVQYLLLGGARHPLAEFYPSVGGTRAPHEAFPAFADFCRRYRDPIVELISTRRVQTNEVGRCGPLLVAFAQAWQRLGGRPLFMIEIGCSAGLQLCFDRYHYAYTRSGAVVQECGPDSPARVVTELVGDGDVLLPEDVPPVAGRVGVDVAPIDVTDDEAVRWNESLLWADQTERLALFRAAVELARQDPPRIVEGDGLALLPELIDSAPRTAVPCVFHSHATYLMNSDWRRRLSECIAGLGAGRDLAHVSLEWIGDASGPELHLTTFSRGRARTALLAECHHHGAWMRWCGDGGSG